jgi:hypothetical protein
MNLTYMLTNYVVYIFSPFFALDCFSDRISQFCRGWHLTMILLCLSCSYDYRFNHELTPAPSCPLTVLRDVHAGEFWVMALFSLVYHHIQFICWNGVLLISSASNCNALDLHLLIIWDYRHIPPCPTPPLILKASSHMDSYLPCFYCVTNNNFFFSGFCHFLDHLISWHFNYQSPMKLALYFKSYLFSDFLLAVSLILPK